MIFPSIAFGENDIYTDVKKSANELAEVLVNDYNVSGVQYALISDEKIVVSGTSGIFHKANVKNLDNKSIFGEASITIIVYHAESCSSQILVY